MAGTSRRSPTQHASPRTKELAERSTPGAVGSASPFLSLFLEDLQFRGAHV